MCPHPRLMPRALSWLICGTHQRKRCGRRLQVCPTPQRYKYAYAVVWEGTFTGCHWATGDCIAPLQGQDCVTLRCDNSDVVCPPNCGSCSPLRTHPLLRLEWLPLFGNGLRQHRGRVAALPDMQCKVACVIVLQGWSGVRGGRALPVARSLARDQPSADFSSSHGRLSDHIERRSVVMARDTIP